MKEEMGVPSDGTLPRKLTSNERLIGSDASVGEFWAWAYSDMLSNQNRAVFAEFIVGHALGVTGGIRREWDYVDHQYNDKTIEVRATGFAQRWSDKTTRSPRFKIRKSKGWRAASNEYGLETVRSADCYVFCVYTETERSRANVLDLSKWEFLIISTEKLNRIFENQHSVALSVIRKHCESTDFNGLKATVDAALMGG
jgi:hypothetical protein